MDTCTECGATVDGFNSSKHSSWHRSIDRKIKDAMEKAEAAYRDARRAKRG